MTIAETATKLLSFNVLDRWTGEIKFTAQIDCTPDTLPRIKLGLAVRWAIKNKADLSGADLRSADLRSADLRSANLRSADLRSANLGSANLGSANLGSANLSGANLGGADLGGANLGGADLGGADLRSADLRSADLRSADLSGADLGGADLGGADLGGAKNADLAIAQTRILPEGALIGWKKCRDNVIVKLRIPEEARRSHAFGRKCRAEYADVLEIFGVDGPVSIATSSHDASVKYIVGERVTPDDFDENWMDECSHGIHFFISRTEAENY